MPLPLLFPADFGGGPKYLFEENPYNGFPEVDGTNVPHKLVEKNKS